MFPATPSSDVLPAAAAPGNSPPFTVSSLAHALRRALERDFSRITIRAEVGRVTRAASGHVYFDLKDDKATLAAVMWHSTAARAKHLPEQGMEVLCSGKVTVYPPRSSYQIIVESVVPAGAGALMLLLESRRKKLSTEGLFDEARKKPLPTVPRVLGVITSPSGAVWHDILHRLRGRFFCHTILWPVRVQGEHAAHEICAAIHGFNALEAEADIPRPDVIIVARGGGSFEDLWPFNEEAVVRAAAESCIPLISAVGHETDWTLLDHAADLRAPTPTAAAELATPVRSEILSRLERLAERIIRICTRTIESHHHHIGQLMRILPRGGFLHAPARRQLDEAVMRFDRHIHSPHKARAERLSVLAQRFSGNHIPFHLHQKGERLGTLARWVNGACSRKIAGCRKDLERVSVLLPLLSHERTLRRGFALVWKEDRRLLRRAQEVPSGARINIQLAAGERVAASISPSPGPREAAGTIDPHTAGSRHLC